MKKIRISVMGFLSIIFFMHVAHAQFVKASLQASGLTCSMCSKATQEALATLPFVQSIVPDLNTNTFALTFKKEVPVSIDALRKKVEDAGFSVAKLVLTADFNHVKITNDVHINYAGNILHFVNVREQILNGDQHITVIDKGFIPEKQFKKYGAVEKMDCYKTGKITGTCCKVEGKVNSDRVYHVTI